MNYPELHIVTTGRQELDEVAAILERCPSALIHTLHVREKRAAHASLYSGTRG
ncbi:hypothetical protein LJK87_03700 [Paenibacillus sp. P25]|nr:hypothetical protein LJK87_03700 [Paenibacillus sp. P25]